MTVPHSAMQPTLRQISPEVFYSDGGFLAADDAIVSLLKRHAAQSARRRCRLCFHADPSAGQQEMLIVMHRSAYVRPARHIGKVETLSVIEGECLALLFDDDGKVTEALPMAPPASGKAFFYRMPERQFHTLLFQSEWLVFIETTIGPFSAAMTEFPAWAPDEVDIEAGRAYLARQLDGRRET